MSKVVDLADLEAALAEFGSGYLLTVGDQHRVKLVATAPTFVDDAFTITAPGPGTVANAAVHPAVTLLFPPLEQPGLSLIIDGTAQTLGEDIVVHPANAILHRPA
jgi:hypothetical protein